LLAGFVVPACRFIYLSAAHRLLDGQTAGGVYPDYVAVVNTAFDMTARATP
jgi:hypothetical protein